MNIVSMHAAEQRVLSVSAASIFGLLDSSKWCGEPMKRISLIQYEVSMH